jgi:hypothetical protein
VSRDDFLAGFHRSEIAHWRANWAKLGRSSDDALRNPEYRIIMRRRRRRYGSRAAKQ